jgi:CheY-like chemotaxis protein
MPQVISVGKEPELLQLRHAVLESAGFTVHTTSQEEEALEKMRHGNFGILLLCYTLRADVRKRLAENARKFCPKSRVVLITNTAMENQPVFADTMVYGIEGPEALIQALRN